MPVLQITITACSPLVFSERRADGQFRSSVSYIPGAVLRGALAQQLIDAGELGNTPESDFARLFTMPDKPFFRNAYPSVSWGKDLDNYREASLPLPATAYSCKAESGFDRHGVYDSLIDRLCSEELKVKWPYHPRCLHPDHDHQNAERVGRDDRVENFTGFRARVFSDPHEWKSPIVPTQLTTRVALNRRRKVAEDQLLYSPMVISEARREQYRKGGERIIKTVFHGSIVTNENNQDLVKKRLWGLTHIGSGAARGFGWVSVQPDEAPIEKIKAKNALKTRVREFNRLLKKRWGLWERLSGKNKPLRDPGHGTFFSILLVSDAILLQDEWMPTVRLEPPMLGESLADAELLRCYANPEYRGGWNTGQRLPKDTVSVASMGSVYIYHTRRDPDDESLLEALSRLEEQGVGDRDRRAEGFGQVRICDEFHQTIQEVKKNESD